METALGAKDKSNMDLADGIKDTHAKCGLTRDLDILHFKVHVFLILM